MPRATCCGSRLSSLFTAPRALNEPVICKHSSFKYNSLACPAGSLTGDALSNGVWRTYLPTLSLASSIALSCNIKLLFLFSVSLFMILYVAQIIHYQSLHGRSPNVL